MFCCGTQGKESVEEWSSSMLREMYRQCLKANNNRLIVYGLFARANAVNNNQRLYPRRILAREVRRYVKQQIEVRCALGELDHPSYSSPAFKHLNFVNVSHQVLSVKWKGNALWGYIEVLDTPSGRLIRELYQHGCKLGVSSRGWASLREIPSKQYKTIMDNFELITFDFVTEPSTEGAWLLPYTTAYQAPVPEQAYVQEVSRLGVGAVPPEQFRQLPAPEKLQSWIEDYAKAVQQQQRSFHVKRMLGPEHWIVHDRATDANTGERKLSEPAATDTSQVDLCEAICADMGEHMPLPTRPPFVSSSDHSIMQVPMSWCPMFNYPVSENYEAPVGYGAYVAVATLYGVPSQRGLRDYWRHAYLFRQRALSTLTVQPAGAVALDSLCVADAEAGDVVHHDNSCSSLGSMKQVVVRGDGVGGAGAPPPLSVQSASSVNSGRSALVSERRASGQPAARPARQGGHVRGGGQQHVQGHAAATGQPGQAQRIQGRPQARQEGARGRRGSQQAWNLASVRPEQTTLGEQWVRERRAFAGGGAHSERVDRQRGQQRHDRSRGTAGGAQSNVDRAAGPGLAPAGWESWQGDRYDVVALEGGGRLRRDGGCLPGAGFAARTCMS